MKSKRTKIIIPSILSSFVILFFLLQPIFNFQTNYFNTPEQAVAHSSGNRGSKIVQTLLINAELGFAFCIDDKDALLIKNINSWTMFSKKKYGCQSGSTIYSYKCNEHELGDYAFLNYKNVDTYFFHSYVARGRGDKFLIIGGLTRLPQTDTLLIDGKKPSLYPVVIGGEKYTIWYIEDSNTQIDVNYDGKHLCTI